MHGTTPRRRRRRGIPAGCRPQLLEPGAPRGSPVRTLAAMIGWACAGRIGPATCSRRHAGGRAMATSVTSRTHRDEVTDDQLEALRRNGITAQKAAFSREWTERLREDIEVAFAEAR